MSYDPWEHATEEERNEWAVRQELYVRRRLAQGEIDWREKNRKMLAAVEPKARKCHRCGKAGTRMIAITGDWFCDEHDPTGMCRARAGAWGCTVSMVDHYDVGRWRPHRFMRLEGE